MTYNEFREKYPQATLTMRRSYNGETEYNATLEGAYDYVSKWFVSSLKTLSQRMPHATEQKI